MRFLVRRKPLDVEPQPARTFGFVLKLKHVIKRFGLAMPFIDHLRDFSHTARSFREVCKIGMALMSVLEQILIDSDVSTSKLS